jgi:3',5'-cyclic AMP phosphodiesterase CpdA
MTETTEAGGTGRPWRTIVWAFLALLLAYGIGSYIRESVEEAPRVAYELGEYVAVTPADLGTQDLFDDPAALKITLRARRPDHVRFIVAGDGGLADDPGKRALARSMRQLCARPACDFILLTGDNVYQEGIDTFGTLEQALADSVRGFDLHSAFLDSLTGPPAELLAARVRAAAGRVARACGGSVASAREGEIAEVAANGPEIAAAKPEEAADSARPGPAERAQAAEAFRKHFEPKFERTFGWLAEEQIPVFLVLGNHDLRSPFGAECEIGYSLASRTAWHMPFYFYQVEVQDPATGKPFASLFALESAPPHADPAGENHSRIGPRQAEWLRSALRSSHARWTLAASHDPLWSAGPHVLTENLSFHRDLPAIAREAGARLDVLLAGHNHWVESARVELDGRPALQIVSGALSKVALPDMLLLRGYPFFNTLIWNAEWRRELVEALATDPEAFLKADQSVLRRGFALVDLSADSAHVEFFGVDGSFYGETLTRAASASLSARPIGIEASRSFANHANGAATRAGGLASGEQASGVSTRRKWE